MNQVGDFSSSGAVVLHHDDAPCVFFREWLGPSGWNIDCRTPNDDFTLEGDRVALIIMDAAIDADERAGFIVRLRALPGPMAGTPVLLLARPDAPGQNGTAGRIDLPLDRAQAQRALEQWAGPIADHRFRDLSSPYYRLMRFAGRAGADRLLGSFVDHLEGALAALDGAGAKRQEDVRRTVHNIAGLAGTLGFADLSRLWAAIDRGESTDPAEARAAACTVIDGLKPLIAKE